MKFSETNSKLKPEVRKHRNNRVINLLESSDKDDEIIEKNNKILLLWDIPNNIFNDLWKKRKKPQGLWNRFSIV